MRYTDIDLQIWDILWFAVDKNGYIGAFTSGGSNVVPEFVCCSKEETEILEHYFLEELKPSTVCIFGVAYEDNDLMRDSEALSQKGLFCFDMSEQTASNYDLLSYPQTPLSYVALPQQIRGLLESHKINSDFTNAKTVQIQPPQA